MSVPVPAAPPAPGLLAARLPSPLTEIADERLARHGVRLLLKRDDLIHPDLPGNKYRKLRLNLAAAAEAGHDTLLTFGGAYSNHLRATAAAGRLLGLRTVGVVRGDELAGRPLNPSLARAVADGMRLDFVDRATYRRKSEPEVLAALLARHGRAYVVPEGGSNALAALGCTDLGRELAGAADVVTVACGTGGTLAGLAAGLPDRFPQVPAAGIPAGSGVGPAAGSAAGPAAGRIPAGPGAGPAAGPASGTPAGSGVGPAAGPAGGPAAGAVDGTTGPEAIGFAVVRGGFLGGEVLRLQEEAFGGRRGRWRLEERFHHGGYARTSAALDAFADDFTARHGLAPERVHVAKMLHGVFTLAQEGAFPPGTRIAAVITG